MTNSVGWYRTADVPCPVTLAPPLRPEGVGPGNVRRQGVDESRLAGIRHPNESDVQTQLLPGDISMISASVNATGGGVTGGGGRNRGYNSSVNRKRWISARRMRTGRHTIRSRGSHGGGTGGCSPQLVGTSSGGKSTAHTASGPSSTTPQWHSQTPHTC